MKITFSKNPLRGDLSQIGLESYVKNSPMRINPVSFKLLVVAALTLVAAIGYSQPNDSLKTKGSRVSPKEKTKVYKKNFFGKTVVEDDQGREIATFRKDIFGNDVEEDNEGNVRVYNFYFRK